MNEQYIQNILIDWTKVDKSSYLKKIRAIKNLKNLEFKKPITFFVGENGSGKSTLLHGIATSFGFNPEGGTPNYSFSTYDSECELYKAIRLSKGYRKPDWGYYLRAESFYNVATQEENYADIFHSTKSYHEKSHGECFLDIAQEQFNPNGIYLLDEPEAALSPQRQLTFLMEIYECAKQGSQFIIATHSPILLGIPEAEIISFDKGHIGPCLYEETDSYQITHMFINNRKQILSRLLGI